MNKRESESGIFRVSKNMNKLVLIRGKLFCDKKIIK